jgi:flagellar biosynthesis protein FlhG
MDMIDQAKQLRDRLKQKGEKNHSMKIIAVTSGKGGVGKSNFALNFALSLIEQNKKVLLFDVDLGLANVDVLMGISSKTTVVQMVEQEISIWDIIQEGPNGLKFIAGGTGFQSVFEMNEQKLTWLFQQLSSVEGTFDYIILDTGAGLSAENVRFLLAADDIILVTTPEPTAITDAYAVVKMLHKRDEKTSIRLIVNQCTSTKEGEQTAFNFQRVSKKFLEKDIKVLGFIPDDEKVVQAVKEQRPFFLSYPNAEASQALTILTHAFLDIQIPYKLGVKGFLLKIFSSRN